MAKQAQSTAANPILDSLIPAADRRYAGDNVCMGQRGSLLVVVIDTAQNFGASASGKTQIVASTRGNAEIHTPHGTIKLGVNCYKTL